MPYLIDKIEISTVKYWLFLEICYFCGLFEGYYVEGLIMKFEWTYNAGPADMTIFSMEHVTEHNHTKTKVNTPLRYGQICVTHIHNDQSNGNEIEFWIKGSSPTENGKRYKQLEVGCVREPIPLRPGMKIVARMDSDSSSTVALGYIEFE